MVVHQVGQALDIALTQGVVIHRLYRLQTGPAQQGAARGRGFEQAMQVGAEDLPVGALDRKSVV